MIDFNESAMMSYSEKIKAVAKKLDKNSILILFSSDPKRRNRDVFYKFRNNSDILYLTGLNFPEIILCLDSEEVLNIFMKFPDPEIERWQGKMTQPDYVTSQLGIDGKQIHEYTAFKEKLPEILKNKKSIYLDLNMDPEKLNQIIRHINNLNKNTRDKTFGPENIISAGSILHEVRIFKTNGEIKKIRQAIDITGNGFIETMKWTRKNLASGIFEYQIKSKIEEIFQFFGSHDLAYPTIVASGNNANYLHYDKCLDKVFDQDLVLVDAGCEWNSYASDITRTFPVSGKFTEHQKNLYNIVLNAQKNAIKLCKTGKCFEDIHQITVETIVDGLWELNLFSNIIDVNSTDSRLITPSSKAEIIDKKYYRLYYMHYTSHYLGLDVHDVGSYYDNNISRQLSNGMIFTIEPGIYIHKDYDFVPIEYRGIGIRIEDDILIHNEKPDVLSCNIPKEITEIEELN
jgi:Xaa-Pro aminopeptidase